MTQKSSQDKHFEERDVLLEYKISLFCFLLKVKLKDLPSLVSPDEFSSVIFSDREDMRFDHLQEQRRTS